MNQVLDGIDKVVTAISGVLYMPWVPFLLLAAGLFFTFRSKFMQVRLLGESFRVVSEKPKTKGGISSFGALMVSTLPGWVPATSSASPPPSAWAATAPCSGCG